MKVLVILIVVSMCGSQYVNYDKAVQLFKKYVTKQLTSDEEQTVLNDVVEVLKLNQYWYKGYLSNTTPFRTKLLCFGCRVLANVFFDAVQLGWPDQLVFEMAEDLCIWFRLQGPEVCKGLVKLNLPILIYIVKKVPQASPNTFCGLILQTDDDPDACVIDDPRFEWQISLPDYNETAVKKKRKGIPHSKPLTAALITDVHIDPHYEPQSVADCAEPTCCRKESKKLTYYRFNASVYGKTFIEKDGEIVLDLSYARKLRKIRKEHRIIHLRKSSLAGYWGDYRSCDTPLWTFKDTVDRISRVHKKVDVVYYLGDTIDHHVWDTTYTQNKRLNSFLISQMRKKFKGHVKIVPVVGNHESQPINQFAPSLINDLNLNTTWLYKLLTKKWKLDVDARATFWSQGGYTRKIRPGLRAVIINTNVAYRYNWWVLYDPLKARDHLNWIVKVLYKAELTGEKVHILSHIPPGVSDLYHTWTREYNKVVNRFSSTIAAEFNGHTHSDEFKVFFSSDGKPSRVAWNVGGLTTYTNFNPNYKIIKFHEKTREPTKIMSFIFNLTAANLKPKENPRWYRLYEFKKDFQLPDLSPRSLGNLVSRMVNDSTLSGLYADFVYKMSDARPKCDEKCRFSYLCNAVVTVLWDRKKCDELGINNLS